MSSPRIKLKLNNRILFKGSVGEWESKPPDMFKDAINPGAKPEPWLITVSVALASYLRAERSVEIEVKTFDDGWLMRIKE